MATSSNAPGGNQPRSADGKYAEWRRSKTTAVGGLTAEPEQSDRPVVDIYEEPLSRTDLMRAWAIEAQLAQDQTATAPPHSNLQVPDGVGGTWRVSLGDWDPANTEACGIIEQGQYTALHYDADGNQLDDFSADAFENLGKRREAAARTAEFIIRAERVAIQRAAGRDHGDDGSADEDVEHDEECAEEIRHSGACKHGPAYPASMSPASQPASTAERVTCPDCGGSGWEREHGPAAGGGALVSGQCPTCQGSGHYDADPTTAYGCTRCEGKGWEWSWGGQQIECPDCGGEGAVPGTPAGRDDVIVRGHGEFHRSRTGVWPDEPYAMRFEADRPLSDAEMRHMAQAIGYSYAAQVRGEQMGEPVRDSDRSFVISADTTKSRSDDLGYALEAFERDLPKMLREGSPVRKTDRAGAGTAGTRLVDGLGADAPEVTVYYDSVTEQGGY